MASENRKPDFVEYASTQSFALTVDRVTKAIEGSGMRIFARIDHAAGAREVGLVMPPTLLLLYGHPKGGTPIMLATPQAALDLPLRVLLREDDRGQTILSFHPVIAGLAELGVPTELAVRLEPAQRILLDAIQP